MSVEIDDAERIARRLLAANGDSDPHPEVLADTIREVEYQGLAEVQATLPTLPIYTVDKNEYEVPCTHPMCHVFHKNLPEGHHVSRTEWVILEDGARGGEAGMVDSFERKRDALAYIARHFPQQSTTR